MAKMDINKIRDKHDIAELIGRYVALTKDGSEFKACCPFHEEKTPSFSVVPDKGFYHCFGCGAHGDVIDFVSEYQGISFRDACEQLGGDLADDFTPVKPKPAKERFDPYKDYTPVKTGNLIEPGQKIDLINPKRDGKVWRNAQPLMASPYYTATGDLHGYVLRLEIDGEKQNPMVRWCKCPDGSEGWCRYPFEEPRLLYGLNDLIDNPNKQVLITEGEKACDAAHQAAAGKVVTVTWSGGTNAISKSDWGLMKGRKVILWPDNDPVGQKAALELATILIEIGAESVHWIIVPEDLPDGWDCADREWTTEEFFAFCREYKQDLPKPQQEPEEPEQRESMPPEYCYGADEHLQVPEKPQQFDWRAELMQKDDGSLVGNVHNAQLMLGYHPAIKGVLAYNEFTKQIDIVSRPPWQNENAKYPRQLTDVDDTRATAWLERKGIKLGINVVHNTIVSAAHHNPYNPLQNYLNSLQWDGTQRLEMALHYLMGCPDNEYVRAVSKRFLIGAVARALDPGCKMDTMLILEGDQGLKKSTAIGELFGEDWFTDELSDLGSKDAAMQIQGVWGVEIAELSQMNRAEAARIKEWITRQVDRFRPPYGRNIISAPRQCVLIGTVNPEGGYLKDATGGRRFWPVKCSKINIGWIKQRRDQLWAEAVVAYRSGERWWFDNDERHIAQAEQEERYESDPWSDRVLNHVRWQPETSVSEIMGAALELPSSQQTQQAQNRIAKILVADGWKRIQRKVDNKKRWLYVKSWTAPGYVKK